MSGLCQFLRRYWPGSPAVTRGVIPRFKYRVTSHQNPFAFRRALLREALARLKRIPLDRAAVGEAEERAGRGPGTERW